MSGRNVIHLQCPSCGHRGEVYDDRVIRTAKALGVLRWRCSQCGARLTSKEADYALGWTGDGAPLATWGGEKKKDEGP